MMAAIAKYALQKVAAITKTQWAHFPIYQHKTGSTNNLRDSWFAGFDQMPLGLGYMTKYAFINTETKVCLARRGKQLGLKFVITELN